MKVSDYIVDFLSQKGITDVFGYPGGMVTHLMDSFEKYQDRISAHVTYHEQGAAFAACAYAQVSGLPGVAYATSGPGATNLITGIANAYFDSIPAIFITGQVNTTEAKGVYGVRQRGFQETDIVSIVKPVTKYAKYVENAEEVPEEFEKAYQVAMEDRRGPVLLDIPMNVFRAEVEPQIMKEVHTTHENENLQEYIKTLQALINNAQRPCLLIGNGVKSTSQQERIADIADLLGIPIVTSMLAFDVVSNKLNFGFIGAYGNRTANFVVARCDLLITIGTRLDVRQVGAKRENFAPDARIVRFDVDEGELSYPTHDELHFQLGMEDSLKILSRLTFEQEKCTDWLTWCEQVKEKLSGIDDRLPNTIVNKISHFVPKNTIITTDVGQNQVWVAQSFAVKPGQRVLFSGGHGAMGYSLPAAIGACHASENMPVLCITGDGGLQMNIQELQYLVRVHLPVKIVVLNNTALGMIRHFQEMYFEGRYFQTKPEGGYTAPCFADIAKAYGIKSRRVRATDSLNFEDLFADDEPYLLEIMIEEDTYIFPKLEFGKPNQDQEPLIDRKLYKEIMDMDTKKLVGGG